MFCQFLLLLAPLLLLVSSHARLAGPQPRTDNANIKVGPCGDPEFGSGPSTTLEPGPFEFQWTETINHPGSLLAYHSFLSFVLH